MNDHTTLLDLLHQLTDEAGKLDTHLSVVLELPSHTRTVTVAPKTSDSLIHSQAWGGMSVKFDELVAESEKCNTPLVAKMSTTVGEYINDSGIWTAYYP